ncbi:hypothetical protein NDA07_06955 [Microcoleus vaginatus DQ-U2]|uniref:hypothetical protein n=1 Tax=Microcoleus vaginatus TaxID=119532 RepID=UPI0016893A86|nr:hypothetical protein [Microcoleus sp. FACHB-DQ6]
MMLLIQNFHKGDKSMIAKDRVIQKNDSQKLADISLNNDKSNELWCELSETSEAAVSGGTTVLIVAIAHVKEDAAFAAKK